MTVFVPGQNAIVPVTDTLEMVMIWCPTGEFFMGDPADVPLDVPGRRNLPQHRVHLTKEFWIGQTPVTQEVWLTFLARNTVTFRSGENLPANGMSWNHAHEFCDILTRHLREKGSLSETQQITLPHESQWEYACRAGTQTLWYFGDDEVMLKDHAWIWGTCPDVQPVAQKGTNPWGLYDLYGNVEEWCANDIYSYTPIEEVDPAYDGDDDLRTKVTRGGSTDSLKSDCRSAHRGIHGMDNDWNEPTGVRIVCVDTRESGEYVGGNS